MGQREEGGLSESMLGVSIQPHGINPKNQKTYTISGGVYKQTDASNANTVLSGGNNVRNLKYNEEDGFMRGARIAEKIQEFYNTSGGTVQGVPGPG